MGPLSEPLNELDSSPIGIDFRDIYWTEDGFSTRRRRRNKEISPGIDRARQKLETTC